MAKTKKAFIEVNNINELKDFFQKNIKYLTNGYFNPDLLEFSISSLDNLTIEQNKYLFSLIHELDSKMNQPGQANQGLYQKIPTILSGIIYITNYFDKIKQYQPYELATLSNFSIPKELSDYEYIINKYTPNILKETLNKTKDFYAHQNILHVVEKMLEESKTEQEIINYIKNTNYEKIRMEFNQIYTEIKRTLGVI